MFLLARAGSIPPSNQGEADNVFAETPFQNASQLPHCSYLFVPSWYGHAGAALKLCKNVTSYTPAEFFI